MSQLVESIKNEAVTNSLNISASFNKRHDHILRDIEDLKKDVPNFGEMFIETNIPDSYNRSRRAYFINRDGFALLAMGFTGKKAMQFKLKYIEAFKKMEQQIKNGSYKVPKSFSDALRLAADKQEQIELMKPKVRFADSVASSDTSIAVGDLAKILKKEKINIGQNRLFDWLRNNNYLIGRKGVSHNMPTQISMDMQLFEINETVISHSDGHTTIVKTPKVTGKGQQYFINKFLKEA